MGNMSKHKPEDMVTITMTRGQAECIERIFRMFMSKGSKGREFSAWRALRRGLGTWKEEKDTLRGKMKEAERNAKTNTSTSGRDSDGAQSHTGLGHELGTGGAES